MNIGMAQRSYGGGTIYPNQPKNIKNSTNMTEVGGTARASAKQPLVLHYFDSGPSDDPVGAICDARTGISTTVYQSADDSKSHSGYEMRIWQPDGDVEERMFDVDKFDPKDADSFEQYAFSCFAQKEYGSPLTSTLYPTHDEVDDPLGCLYQKRDWTEVYKKFMDEQYHAGCFDGYLKYKAIYDRMIERSGL